MAMPSDTLALAIKALRRLAVQAKDVAVIEVCNAALDGDAGSQQVCDELIQGRYPETQAVKTEDSVRDVWTPKLTVRGKPR